MQTEKNSLTGLQRTARIFLRVILFLFLFIVAIFLLLLTPPVQKFATGKIENFLEKKLQTKVEIGSISIGLPRKVVLQNIYVEDRAKDTLLYGGSIKADIALFRLLSNEVQINSLQLTDITAKVKRTLPDTAFNFQFIVDAFATQQVAQPDTAATAVMKLEIDDIWLDNCRILYQDVVTGNDMFASINDLKVTIDTLDPYLPQYDIASLKVNGMKVRFNQTSPLAKAESIAADMAEAAQPAVMKLNFGSVILDSVDFDYNNETSAFYTNLDIGHLELQGELLDLQNRIIHFDKLKIDNTVSAIRLGKKEAAKAVEKEIEKEIKVQQQNDWSFRINEVEFNNNKLQFDNDNTPAQPYGLDYAHLSGDKLDLHIQNFVLNKDSIGGSIKKGTFTEKSGFQLDALEGDILYASNQAYLKNLLIKTPGTEIKRSAVLEYASYDALVKNFEKTVLDIELVNSYVQVKDILAFAPQLRSNAAFSNPADVWQLNIIGSGTIDRLHFDALQFDGLKDTRIDASGTLASLTDPNAAGGTFTIRKFHTSQSDIALFTGQRLSTPQINLPETFDASGTLSGNINNLTTNLNIATSVGAVAINGRFTNLTNPAKATYAARINTKGLRLGSILRNPQLGSLSANMNVNGSGFTPDAMNTNFKGVVHAVGFNNYTYRNIFLDGSLKGDEFNVVTDIRDPNIDLKATASGNIAAGTFAFKGFVDSIKTLPLKFTTQPLVFRGKIDADVISFSPDFLNGSLTVTDGFLVTAGERIPLDTLQLTAGRNNTAAQFISLRSEIANADISGQYRLTELGNIFLNNINPYFSLSPTPAVYNVHPYDFTFRLDVLNSPALSAFVPGLQITEPLHAEGRLVTGQGLQASAATPFFIYGTNEISGLNIKAHTTASGLQLNGSISHLKSGNAWDVYNTRINATALNNIINFNLGVDDANNRNKYRLGGVLSQPASGTYALQLRPDSLLLNYEPWNITANNRLVLSPQNISAQNFTLSKGIQQLSINSLPGSGVQPLNVSFANFNLGTITGFIKSDSLLVDGTMNGTVTLQNLMQQPVFTSNLTINDLSLKQDTIGNVNVQVNNATANRYNTNITISGRGNDVALTGYFAPQADDILLNLDLAVRQIQLSTFEGALAEFIKEASGAVNGNVQINGTTAAPKIQGTLNFDTASITTRVLGGPLTIDNEKLTVTENGFSFDQFAIRDSAKNALTIDGTVRTTNFINYGFDLDVSARNFRALNTTKGDNKLFYGQLTLNTDLHISGTEMRPIVDGSAVINEGTDFTIVIPQVQPGVVERQGVVEFVDFDSPENDSLFLAYDSLNVTDILGLDITANIEIQKEASFNVIIDVANGDLLSLKGQGQLTTGIDPSGKITLTGTYEIEEGAYQFSFNFLRRRFAIEKGSKITWLGEPTSAQLDVTAKYIANTAPLDLVQDQITDQAQRNYYLQKLPFEVLLNLEGELLKPQLTFDIVLPTEQNYNVSGDILGTVRNRLAQLRQEPSELNKQVFSVLLLNRFVGDNPFASSGGGGGFNAGSFARTSVSKLLTEQLNELAGGLIGGVDLNFDVASSDDYTTGERRSRTDLNVGLSKRLLNERLTVTVGSNFQLEGPSPSQQGSNNIAGNVSVNYQLSRDGRYMLRFYRKNEYEGLVDGYVIETGLGFIISVDYNNFRQLLPGKTQRREKRKTKRENREIKKQEREAAAQQNLEQQ